MWSTYQTTNCPNNSFMGNFRLGGTLRVARKRSFDINCDSWEQKAIDRPQWHFSIFNGLKAYESNRKSSVEQKRLARKICVMNATNDAGNIPCPNYNKTFHVQIGLFSHLRTHNLGWWKAVVIESDGQLTHLYIVTISYDVSSSWKIN